MNVNQAMKKTNNRSKNLTDKEKALMDYADMILNLE